ncbi:MAG TPA: UDP-N-acetylmuramate dehydrogenase, partial [Bryobacteraceae bacterium]|nr:UDP-N-acetylmuramate dehydrogenase [Bryobacteraceae bacterium]
MPDALGLEAIAGLKVSQNVSLSDCTRFGIGGPAAVLADAATEDVLVSAISALRQAGAAYTVIGGGTNLIVSDEGVAGVVLRYMNSLIAADGEQVMAASGAVLQDLVDRSISLGLRGLETLTGIPGWVGGAIYGNAGAYGHSMHEFVHSVRYLDAARGEIREIENDACEFRYRDSAFKRHKDRIVLSTILDLTRDDTEKLRDTASGIRKIRDEKYPPTMRCAGSIFKNLILAELPEPVRTEVPLKVVREGKVASAYFLERAGAKGMRRGGVEVAEYHANLIFNSGGGTAHELRGLIAELKQRVRERFAIELE